MVQLTKIYTKSGDKGKTSLGNGQRIFKDHLRTEAMGAVDETNAFLGVCVIEARDSPIFSLLQHIQNDLFDLGADLCMPGCDTSVLRMAASQVSYIEDQIDHFNATLSPLTSFVLPGGSSLSAYLHLARVTARRAERCIIKLNRKDSLNPSLIQYINRLSDLLFVLARYANTSITAEGDVLWIPGKSR